MSKGLDFTDKGLKLIQFYRENPVIAASDLLGVDLPPAQRLVLKDMWTKPYVLVTASRGTGKSFLLSVISCLYALLYPGKKVLIMSPSFRQSRIVFDEVDRRFIGSPILREACTKRPTVGPDRCYLPFRGADNLPGSLIAAFPTGDSGKIRGLRGHLIVADEFVQIPEEVFDMVVMPMGATTNNPMENVKNLQRLKDGLETGVLTQEDYDNEVLRGGVNKIICTSSAYYQFNHMFKRIKAYEQKIASGSKEYAVHYISYKDMPPGFLNMSNIENAKATLSKSAFAIEYEAKWISDSDGIFKASLVEQSKDGVARAKTKGSIGAKYIIGVDPARSSDAFAVVVIEVGKPSYVVSAFQTTGKKFPQMAQIIWDFCDRFDTRLVMMDAGSGGGGVAIKDILSNQQFFPSSNLLLDQEDPDHLNLKGRHIIRMVDPKPKSIADANYAALNLLEQGVLKFPYLHSDISQAEEEIYVNISEMLKQMMAITVTETKSGLAHFDIPATGSGSRKKDLYSAFILAAKGLYDTYNTKQEINTYINKGGLIIPTDRYKGPAIISATNLPGRTR